MERHTVIAAETLAKAIIANYDNPLQSSSIDVPAHVETLLQSLEATASDSGGKVTYYGSDPITPDRLPYGSISAISLAAKAILIAKIWKERTRQGQDIHVDVRKSLRRLTPFLEGKWEPLPRSRWIRCRYANGSLHRRQGNDRDVEDTG